MRFIDSNVFIYHLAADPTCGQKAKDLMEKIESGEKSVTSTLVIAQVCSYLKWKKKTKRNTSISILSKGTHLSTKN